MQSDDLGLVARLKSTPEKHEERMQQWDAARKLVRNGNSGSLPRDIVESVISGLEEDADEAAAAIERLVAERDEARALVTEANNSLYGSQGYFHSLNGGPFDKYHLASGIEKLKSYSNQQWRRAEAAEALLDFATFSPWLRDWCKRRFGKWITHNTAKGALNDLRARQALKDAP